jgi:hypothetical protein
MARVTKDSAVDRKLRAVEDELNALKKGMKSLSKEMGKRRVQIEDDSLDIVQSKEEIPLQKEMVEVAADRIQPPLPVAASLPDDTPVRTRTVRAAPTQDRIHEGRFADYYVANSYRSNRPLRHELKTQRARAVFMLICAVLLGWWFLYMYGPKIAEQLSNGRALVAP